MTPDAETRFAFSRNHLDQPYDPFDKVIDIGEVALHPALAVDVDRPAFEDGIDELEQRHVRPAPGAVNGEEAKDGRRNLVADGHSECAMASMAFLVAA